MPAKVIQKGLRLDEDENAALCRVAAREGRSEQDVIRASLHQYFSMSDDRQAFVSSVEQGWTELHSGLGEIVEDDDNFFDILRGEILDEKAAA